MAASRVAVSTPAKAQSVGANTVRAGAELSVSTRPASVTAAVRVVSTGLLDAAVATGSSVMPARVPSSDPPSTASTMASASQVSAELAAAPEALPESMAVSSPAMVVSDDASAVVAVSLPASVASSSSSPPQAAAVRDRARNRPRAPFHFRFRCT
jgi:hypothetical protein